MLLVLSSRDYGDEDIPILRELLGNLEPILASIEIGPLPREDCENLARLLAGSDQGDQASLLAAECEGNPFLLGELARYVRSEEGATARSLRLEDVFGRRLATRHQDQKENAQTNPQKASRLPSTFPHSKFTLVPTEIP